MARAAKQKEQLALRGHAALEAGDYALGEHILTKAVAADKRNARLRMSLAFAHQQLGYVDQAAQQYTEALALKPRLEEAAQRLNWLVLRYKVTDPAALNRSGLAAALSHTGFEAQPIVDITLAALMQDDALAEALQLVAGGDGDAAASKLLTGRLSRALRDNLMIAALRTGKVTNYPLEELLTAVRRKIVTDIGPERMREDKDILPFVMALIAQCDLNEYVWAASDDERAALNALSIDFDRLQSGDLGEAWTVCLKLLYAPVRQLGFGLDDQVRFENVRPKALATYLVQAASELQEEKQIAATMPSLCPPSDDVGRRVANQYEANPYPRWKSFERARPGALRKAMGRYFSETDLAFMDAPFDVLIAGCGTGKHAVQSASAYGPNATVTAIDISIASLTYGQRMSAQNGIENISFAQADILESQRLGRQFDIIESVGVLHHMADPFAGWRSLIGQLKPGGLFYIGLYSAISRRKLAALRSGPQHPGADCSDDEARAYRRTLIKGGAHDGDTDSNGAAELLINSADFYSLSEFRDLILHQNEHQHDLAQIENFMTENNLAFHGFTIDAQSIARFEEQFPDDPWPGTLSNWASLEEKHPNTFDAMYRFWSKLER